TDPSGLNIYYCLDPTAAGTFGHAAIIIGPVDKTLKYTERVYDEKTKKVTRTEVETTVADKTKGKDNFILISVAEDYTIFKDGTWINFLPGKDGVPIKLDVYHYPSLKDALFSDQAERYTVIGAFKTSKDQDHKVLEEVGKRWDNSGFRLLWRNCSNLAFDALHIAGVIAKEPPKFPGPNYRAKWLASAFREKDKDKVFWMIKEDG